MTTTAPVPVTTAPAPPRLRYGALLTMTAMSFLLVTAEFLPGGVLTEIATDIGVSTGQAGLMVAVTALAGLIVAPTIGLMFPRLDRRALLVWMAVAATVSNAIVAIAPNLPLLLIGRVLLGGALSGFWAMSITVAAKIAGPDRLGKAVMFTTAGGSLATVAGVPVGVMLSGVVGWQGVFGLAAVATALLAVALRVLLPQVPSEGSSSLKTLVGTLRLPGIGLGFVGHILVVLGHFLAYTYIRVALERVQDAGHPIDAGLIIALLAAFGVGGLAGNFLIGLIVDRSYAVLAVVTPVVVAASVIVLIAASGSPVLVGVASFVWGFFFASWLLIVNTWVGKRMPDRLEAGGSISVVGFQAAIMIAAAVGGLLVDGLGIVPVYFVGAASLVTGAVLFGLSDRVAARG
ncbi:MULTISPECIES: MFS transporter [unclassified Microbacterium]|uniref:MFS transporter n=1 Tax=unclassified Microbacterium TaxID=2609290 RepID=UPI0012FBA3E4|nr:MFS transporter [Microbacterium sp. MAH-37]MVQ43859.1 MFS transporter [Microbacterium sp. MAH-37]